MNPSNRSFSKKSDIVVIVCVLIIALCAMLGLKLYQQSAADGTLWAIVDAPSGQYRIDLTAISQDTLIDLEPTVGIPATLEVKERQCRLVDVDCPDHICEGFGWLSASYDTATCMPNRFVVGIYTTSEMGSRMETAADITPA